MAFFQAPPVPVGADPFAQQFGQLILCGRHPQLPQLTAAGRNGQRRRLFHAVHGLVELAPVQVGAVLFDQPRDFNVQPVQLHRCAHGTDPFTDLWRRHELGVFLRALRLQSASSFHILIPVLMDGLEDRRFSIAPFGQNLLQAARGLDARRVMVQAEDGRRNSGACSSIHSIACSPTPHRAT